MPPSRVSTPLDFTEYHNTINGLPRKAKAVHNGINPATKAKLWDVPVATQQDLDEAVAAAQKAFISWKKVPLAERQKMLIRYADALVPYHDQLKDLVIQEVGKPV
jgi:acyl-CoA reductase-like NAD-dependent aldehyde dehydrogenase